MKVPLLIYGSGGLGREVLTLVRSLTNFDVIGFIDDGEPKGTVVKGVKVWGGYEILKDFEAPVNLVIALGDPASKEALVARLEPSRFRFPILQHPTVVLQDAGSIMIGDGSILCAGSILTTDIVLGSHVLVNLNCTVGHDTTIGDFSSVMPGVNIAGGVTIGNTTLIGSGCNLLNQITVGDHCIVGMGSVVIHDVYPGTTVAGVPAKGIGKFQE